MIKNEELEAILETIDLREEAPADEPMRQYYFIKKARGIVDAESERLGRRLTADGETFGCQMNTEPEIMKTRINKGFCKRQPQEAAGVFLL